MHVCLKETTYGLNIWMHLGIEGKFWQEGAGTVLISATQEGETVESLWKSPQQLQWPLAGY